MSYTYSSILFLLAALSILTSQGWQLSKRLFSIWIVVFAVIYPVLATNAGAYILFSDREVENGVIVFLIFALCYYFTYECVCFRTLKNYKCLDIKFFPLLSIALTTILLLLDSNNWDWSKIFVRAGVDSTFEIDEYSPWSMIVKNYVRAFAHFCLFFYLINTSTIKPLRKILIVSLLLVVSFPLALPRIQVAILFGPILFYWAREFFYKKLAVEFFVVFSFATVFVGLDFFRKYDDYLESFDYVQYFMSGHFDAFENFLHLLRADYVSYGSQLMGALGFFIPRTFWPTKPVGSGAHTAILQDLPVDNIAMPFAGEGFINFGILGVALFAIAAGIVSNRIDSLSVSPRLTLNTKYYFIFKVTFAMLFFFILRGDLMSGLSFAVATLGALSTIAFLFSASQSSPVLNDDQIFNRSEF